MSGRVRPPVAGQRTKPPETPVLGEMWPDGSVLRNKTNKILGLTIRQSDGSYTVWRLEPVYIGTTKDYASAHSLLVKE
jgi:hypothetical protein